MPPQQSALDGKLNVTIAPNAATDASVQVSFIMVAGKATQRAKVTFETGEGSPIASQVVTVGSTASRPADPTRDLYIFTGWYTDAELTQTFDFSTPITGDITGVPRLEAGDHAGLRRTDSGS